MHEPSASTVAGVATGTAGLSFPWWGELLAVATGLNQFALAALGLIVLVLTARKLWLENRLAAKRLRDSDKGQ